MEWGNKVSSPGLGAAANGWRWGGAERPQCGMQRGGSPVSKGALGCRSCGDAARPLRTVVALAGKIGSCRIPKRTLDASFFLVFGCFSDLINQLIKPRPATFWQPLKIFTKEILYFHCIFIHFFLAQVRVDFYRRLCFAVDKSNNTDLILLSGVPRFDSRNRYKAVLFITLSLIHISEPTRRS